MGLIALFMGSTNMASQAYTSSVKEHSIFSNDVRCRDLGSEESTREEGG